MLCVWFHSWTGWDKYCKMFAQDLLLSCFGRRGSVNKKWGGRMRVGDSVGQLQPSEDENYISELFFSTGFLNWVSQLNFSKTIHNCFSQLDFSIGFLNWISQLDFSTGFLNWISQLYFSTIFLKWISQHFCNQKIFHSVKMFVLNRKDATNDKVFPGYHIFQASFESFFILIILCLQDKTFHSFAFNLLFHVFSRLFLLFLCICNQILRY